MIRLHKGENWKQIKFILPPTKRYAISDFGRLMSYDEDIKDGRLLKGSKIHGYPCLKLKINNKHLTFYVHKLVAQYFLLKDSVDQNYVIHLDFNKKNNHKENLKWSGKDDMFDHQQINPNVLKARIIQAQIKPKSGHKLTAADVFRIKEKIWSPKKRTKLDAIAKFYDVSKMQIYRIKSGENWSHIRVPNEPDSTLKKKYSTEIKSDLM